MSEDFSAGPVVNALVGNARGSMSVTYYIVGSSTSILCMTGGTGSIPGRRTRILHAVQKQTKTISRKELKASVTHRHRKLMATKAEGGETY